jgi:hypothetical protein
LIEGLRKEIKRPATRKRRAREHKSAKAYVGSQEIDGGMTEWTVRYWVQRSGVDWVLHLKGEDGGAERIGPSEAQMLVEEMENRGLELGEFVAQLRRSKGADAGHVGQGDRGDTESGGVGRAALGTSALTRQTRQVGRQAYRR